MGDGNWIRLERSTPPRAQGGCLKLDCAICGDSLEKPGPPIQFFSFGKLISTTTTSELSFVDQELIYREFLLSDPLYKRGTFDCHKVLSTECGHLFHSGCLREWFFMKRHDRYIKCPYCNQRTRYHDCRILHPVAMLDSSDDEQPQKRKALVEPMAYSDVSCASSSYSSDELSEVEEEVAATTPPSALITRNPTNTINNNELIYHLRPIEPQIDIPGGNYNENLYELYEDSEHGDGTNTFINDGVVKSARFAVRTYDKYNVAYACLLIWVFRIVPRCFEGRLKDYMRVMDDAEDEALDDANNIPTSLGYPFILQFLIAGLLILCHEKIMNNIRNLL